MSRKKPKIKTPREQIAERVAKTPVRPPNVIKKIYALGSPGAARKQLGITLTAIKKSINEKAISVTQPLDEFDNPVGPAVEVIYRDTAACTKRRRSYAARGLLARTESGDKRKSTTRTAACNTKGTNKPKKSWHRAGDRLTADARKADAKIAAKKKKAA